MDAKRFLLVALAWFSATFAYGQQAMVPQAVPQAAPQAVGEPSPYQTWGNCATCATCCGMGSFYVSLDYLLWWMKPVCLKVPTLTAGNPADTLPGAFGQPGTVLLAGGSRFEFEGASGLRPRIGVLLTPDGFLAAEAEGFTLQTATSRQSYVAQPGSPATFIPFTAPNGTQQAIPFTVPGLVNGSVNATGSSHLWGLEANVVANVMSNDFGRGRLKLALLAGVRYVELQDEIQLTNVQSLAANSSVTAFGYDRLATRNQFYGVQLGERLEWCGPIGTLSAFGKLAVGETNLANDFGGSPLVGAPVLPGLIPGPINVLASNTGFHSTNRISLLPELGANLRFNVGDMLTISVGYSVLYWNRILCPGDLMDPRVNPTQLPGRGPVTGAALPAVQPLHTDYFAQGLNAGFEFRF